MIIQVQIINQPYSNEYDEIIYDLKSKGNSRQWTWVKFTNEDYTEWCGQFQGSAINIEISEKHNTIVLLTSDYLFMLSRDNGSLIEHENYELYRNLTLTPNGDYLISEYHSIELFKDFLWDKVRIENPFFMDMIKFHEWSKNMLRITYQYPIDCDVSYQVFFNCETLKLTEEL